MQIIFNRSDTPEFRFEKLDTLAHAITQELGVSWSVKEVVDRDRTAYLYAILERDVDKMKIVVQLHGYLKEDRIIVRLSLEQHLAKLIRSYSGEVVPEITVKDNTDSKKIAQQIQSRLLENAVKLYEVLCDRNTEVIMYDIAQNDVLEKFIEAGGGAILLSNANPKDHFHISSLMTSGYGDGYVTADTVHFSTLSLPVDVALKIAAVLAETLK